jgi:hypothetical protein
MNYEEALAELFRLGMNIFDAYNALFEASKMGSFRTPLVDITYRNGKYAIEVRKLEKR